MTENEYRLAIAQQQAAYLAQAQEGYFHNAFARLERENALKLMRAQDRATAERIRFEARGQDPYDMGTPYDIDKPTNPPMKQANARVIEPPKLPEK